MKRSMRNVLRSVFAGIAAVAVLSLTAVPAQEIEAASTTEPIQIVAEYTEVLPDLDVTYHYIVIESTVNEPLEVQANTTATNAAGATVGAAEAYVDTIRPGHQKLITEMFDNTTDAVNFVTTFSTSDSYYEDAAVSTVITAQPGDQKLIVTLTNAGTIPVEFCSATVLFFRDGQVIDHEEQYFTDTDYELKAGASMTQQYDFYNETDWWDDGTYDSYQIYTDGRYYVSPY